MTFKTTGHIVLPMPRPNVRQKIVDAGLKILIEKGFNGCGVQDITAAAGVPKGSFYNHFESKEALGAEVVERYGHGQDNPRRAILADKSISAMQRLRAHFERLNEAFTEARYGRGCLLGNFSAELADQSQMIRERLADLYLAWSMDVAAVIAEAQADGSITTKTPAADLAAFLLDAYEGALLRTRVEKSGRAFDRFMTVAFTQILV
ncbi:transcriptional regulator, TetR family [Rhizobiales bacterium GAS188]|nr:transcriptional regulator, TetR family [Rhizobiales bacterium GAS188]